jgi:hypothetical protein
MTPIDREEALRIARADAEAAYGNLDAYVERAELVEVWTIDYDLRDTGAQGGGPHYVISAETGEILAKRYEQ